jgi:hypothetical protein
VPNTSKPIYKTKKCAGKPQPHSFSSKAISLSKFIVADQSLAHFLFFIRRFRVEQRRRDAQALLDADV